ncbi:MAG: PAS domain-containing protein [Gammaproteobacteria bacterium]
MGKISHHYTLEELEFIIDNLPGHIYWTDKNSVILGCNMNQAKYAGFTNKDEMIGKTDYDMPWKGYAAQIINVNNQVMATKQEIIVEEKVVLPNGKEAYFLSTKKPRYDHDGNVIGILGISTDITSQKIAEEQEKQAIAQIAAEKALAQAEREQRRTLGVIGADIGHDLRTYLGKLSARVSQFSNAWLAFSSNEKYFPDLSDDEVTLNYLTAIDPFA